MPAEPGPRHPSAPPGARARRGGQGAVAGRGRGAAAGPRRRTSAAHGRRRPRLRDLGSRRRRHLLAQGVHPAHDALPRPLPLLHVRQAAREARHPVPHAGGGRGDRRGGTARWAARRRSSRWATGPRSATPSRAQWLDERGLRLHARLRPRGGDPRHRGDGPAAAPEPRRDVVRGDGAAEARERLDGPDARDVVGPARRSGAARTSARRTRCRPCGCAPSRTPAGSPIPFTTGILVGIGETSRERAESLFAIRDLHRRYRHVQEVIVQNFRAKPAPRCATRPSPRTRSSSRPSPRRASCSVRA